MALEILPEKRHVREVQRVGDIMDAQVRGFQLRLRVHDHHRGDNLHARFPRGLLDDRAQVRLRDAEPFGIPRHAPLRGVIPHHQLGEILADLFRLGDARPRLHLVFIHGIDPKEHAREQMVGEAPFRVQPGEIELRELEQQLEIIFEQRQGAILDPEYRAVFHHITHIQDGLADAGLVDEVGGETDKINPQVATRLMDLDDRSGQERDKATGSHRVPRQADGRLDVPAQAKHENPGLQPAGIVPVQTQQPDVLVR